MSVYIIAQLKFTRRELYDRYQSRFMGVFSKFNEAVRAALFAGSNLGIVAFRNINEAGFRRTILVLLLSSGASFALA